MTRYSSVVLDHFQHPRNWGKLEDADGVAVVGESCGDVFKFYVKIENNRLVKVRYQVRGCPAAIACCSMVSVLAEGKPIWEALQITNEDVEKALGGLPPEKLHCSNFAADALHAAIEDYLYKAAEKKMAPKNLAGDGWKTLYLKS